MPEVLETSISWLALRYLKNNSVPSLTIYFSKWQHEVWKTSSRSQKVFKHRHAIRLKYHMHLHSSLSGSLVPDSDIPSQDNGSPEEDGEVPTNGSPPNAYRSPSGHSTHILRNHPNSSLAALIYFTQWGQALLAAQGGAPLPMKRKEIADINYHFAILNTLPLICPILTLMHVFNREGLKFTWRAVRRIFLALKKKPHKNCMGSVPAQDASLLTP